MVKLSFTESYDSKLSVLPTFGKIRKEGYEWMRYLSLKLYFVSLTENSSSIKNDTKGLMEYLFLLLEIAARTYFYALPGYKTTTVSFPVNGEAS